MTSEAASSSLRALLLAAGVAALPGAALVLTSGWGLKWCAATALLLCGACVAILVPDRRLLGICALAAAFPIGVQYRLQTHGSRYFTLQHWGGAPAEPVFNAVDLPLLFLAALWAVDLALRRVRLPRFTRFDGLVLLFLFLSVLSAYNSNEPALLVWEMARYLKYLLLFWVLRSYLGDARQLYGIATVVLAVAALQGLVAAAQYFTSFALPVPVGGVVESSYDLFGGVLIERVTGLVGHPNTFAAYLVPVITLGLAVLCARLPPMYRFAALVPVALASLALLLTFSRNGLLTMGVCALGLAVMTLRTRRLPAAVVPAVVCAVLVAILLFAGFGAAPAALAAGPSSGASVRLGGLLDTVWTRIVYDPGKAIESRWDLLRIAASMVRLHPFIGIGLNSFEENMAAYDRTGTVNVIQQPVHNAPMLVAAETGVASAVIFLVLGAILVRTSWRLLKRNTEPAFVAGVFGLCTFGSLGLSNLFDVTLRKEPIVGMVTLVAALVLAMDARGPAAAAGKDTHAFRAQDLGL